MPAEQLSGTIVVIIIAIGVQGCIMLTIFAKRQVDRLNPADLVSGDPASGYIRSPVTR